MAEVDDNTTTAGVRHRNKTNHRSKSSQFTDDTKDDLGKKEAKTSTNSTSVSDTNPSLQLQNGTFWLTRIVILRYLGFIYCMFACHTYVY